MVFGRPQPLGACGAHNKKPSGHSRCAFSSRQASHPLSRWFHLCLVALTTGRGSDLAVTHFGVMHSVGIENMEQGSLAFHCLEIRLP